TQISRTRTILGWSIASFGLIAALVAYQHQAVGSYSAGSLWNLSEFFLWGLASCCLIPWGSALAKSLFQIWILPGVMATLLLIPFGIKGNDFLTFWLFVIPMVTGSAYFSIRRALS